MNDTQQTTKPLNLPPMFEGDGRVNVHPTAEYTVPGTIPMTLTKAATRILCDRFEQGRVSIHSATCGTLWVIIAYCQWNNYPYKIEYWHGQGATLTAKMPGP